MSISVDNAGSQVNFNRVQPMNLGAKAKEVGGGSAILSGDGLTVTERSSAAAAEGVDTKRSEKTQEAIRVLLQNAEEIDGMVDDLKLLAEQLGETVPPQGTPIPKLELASVQAAVNAFNSEFGTSFGADTVSTLAAGASGTLSDTTTTTTEKPTSDAIAASTKYSAGDTMFSIYEMISLLQDVGQSERDAARELRSAELATELASIDLQANMQRDAAMWGLVTTIVTCCIQVAATVASAGLSADKKTPESSGKIDLEQGENRVNTLKAAEEGRSAQNTQDIEKTTKAENKTAVEERWESCGCNEAKAKYEAAGQKVTDLEGQKAEIDAKLGELEDMDPSKMSAGDVRAYLDRKKSLQNRSAAKQGEIEAAKGDVETAKTAYKESVHKAMDEQQADYDHLSSSTKEAEGKTLGEMKTASRGQNKQNVSDQKTARAKQRDAGEQRTLMEAKGTQVLCELGETPAKTDVETAQMKYAQTEAGLKFDKGYQAANKGLNNPMKAQMAMQLSQILGGLGQSISNSGSQWIQAGATAEQATQEEMKANRDETNELFQQAGDLINTARQLLQSVSQSESQSIEQIIRA